MLFSAGRRLGCGRGGMGAPREIGLDWRWSLSEPWQRSAVPVVPYFAFGWRDPASLAGGADGGRCRLGTAGTLSAAAGVRARCAAITDRRRDRLP